MAIVQGYDGSRHAPTSAIASKVKKGGHTKEEVYAGRVHGEVIKGTQKPDVKIFGSPNRPSVKGPKRNIQLYLCSVASGEKFYGSGSPVHNFQVAAQKHKQFKYDNDGMIDTDLRDQFVDAANNAAEWLRKPKNFRSVIVKVLSDNYDANQVVILEDKYSDAYVFNMYDVISQYVFSDYKVHVTDAGKIVFCADGLEIFYMETRGSTGKVGHINHGVRAPQFYSFLKNNLKFHEVHPTEEQMNS